MRTAAERRRRKARERRAPRRWTSAELRRDFTSAQQLLDREVGLELEPPAPGGAASVPRSPLGGPVCGRCGEPMDREFVARVRASMPGIPLPEFSLGLRCKPCFDLEARDPVVCRSCRSPFSPIRTIRIRVLVQVHRLPSEQVSLCVPCLRSGGAS